MARPKAHFSELDVRKAARGAISAGLDIVRVEIDREGKLVIFTSKSDDAENEASNSCDKAFG